MPGGYFLAGRTSQNPVKWKSNFGECSKGEVRRITIPRTPVNKGGQEEGPELLEAPAPPLAQITHFMVADATFDEADLLPVESTANTL
jgi:hypothetical protein